MSAPASDWLRHFRLLLWNHWMEFNETWKEARSKRPPPRLCFSGRLEKQDSHPGLWLAEAFSTSPLKPLNGIQQNLTGRKISTSSNKFVFFKSIGGTRWPPGLSFAETFSTSPPWPLNKIQRNLTGSKISMSSTNFVLFGPIKKAALASDWLRHFRLLLCDRWTEFNETWQETKFQRRPLPSSCYLVFDETWLEARYQRPLQSLCFSGRSEKQNGRPGLWLAETFSTSLLNRIQQTGTKIHVYVNAIFQVCDFRADRKNYYMWPLGLLSMY